MYQPKISAFFNNKKSKENKIIESSLQTLSVIRLSPNIKYTLFFDGCSKGNPGLAGAGAVIYKDDIEFWTSSIFVGKKETNNVAEYSGLIHGLKEAVRQNIKNIIVKGDSLLVIKQMKGEYQVKSANMVQLFTHAKKLTQQFDTITFEHVYRNDNKRADELSNEGLERAGAIRTVGSD